MPRLRLMLIGTGFFSQYHYDAWSRIDDVEMVGVAYGSGRAKAQAVADRYGIACVGNDVAGMLDTLRPDLVDIISPPEVHLEQIELAQARGVHAITQKPLAASLDEGCRIAGISGKGGSLVVVHENWRFKPWFREIRKLLDQGVLGSLYGASFRMRPGDGQGPRAYLDRQAYFQKMPRFLIHETGVHMVDVFRFLFGEIGSVTARLRRLNPAIAGEDAGCVFMDFADGFAAVLDGNRLVDFEAENPRLTMGQFLVEGEKGQIRLDGDGSIHTRAHRGRWQVHDYAWNDRGYGGDCVHALQRHVVDHLLHGAPVENRAEVYLRNMQVEEAIYRSDREGCRIRVDDIALASQTAVATH